MRIGFERDSNLYKESFDDDTKKGLYWTDKEQLVIPNYNNLTEEFTHSVDTHSYARHYGVNLTLKKAQEVYFWTGMRSPVDSFVKKCDSCQRVQYVRQKTRGALHP
jgi:hypothetical protein